MFASRRRRDSTCQKETLIVRVAPLLCACWCLVLFVAQKNIILSLSICVCMCVCCPFCACNFSFVANSNRFLSAALGALSSFRTTGHGHFFQFFHSFSLSLPVSFAALNSLQHAERTTCGIRNLNVNINLSVKQLVFNYARESCVCLRGRKQGKKKRR